MTFSQDRFTDLFIKRPVLSIVLSLIILLLGIQCFRLLPLRQFPMLDSHKINISIGFPGASPNLVEEFIVVPVENSLSGINGIDYISSNSSQGVGNITIYFNLGYDVNNANTDVANAVASVRNQLPDGVLDPYIAQDDPNADPLIYLSFSSKTLPEIEISAYISRIIIPELSNLPGVSYVEMLSPGLAMRLWLDPQKMTAYHVVAQDISQAIKNNHVQGALGQINGKYQQLYLQGNTALQTTEQFNAIPVKLVNNQLIRLKDVGKAVIGASNDNNSTYINGEQTAVLSIIPTEEGNPLTLSKIIKQLLPSIQKNLPQGMNVKSVWDTSKFISASLHEVEHALFVSILCVLCVIFLFLGSWRSILIPLVTIPLSLFGVSTIMLMLHYSLNTLTFLAWVLAIGLVVDDAIVVLENINRHIEAGKTPQQAALIGAREIAFAVIAMTLTLAAVYAPIGFLGGLTGILFREFAFTLAAAVIVSGIIALTLSPMMCSQLLQPLNRHSFTEKIDLLFKKILERYQLILSKTLVHRKIILIIAILLYLATYFLFYTIPTELAPTEDQGQIYTHIQAPTSANLAYIEKYTKAFDKIYQNIPEREDYGVINYDNSAFSFLTLKPWDERKRSSDEIIEELTPKMAAIPGLDVFPRNPSPLPSGQGKSSISFILKSTGSWEDLKKSADELTEIIKKNPQLANVYNDMDDDQLILNLNVNRDKASSLGINMSDLSAALNFLLGEPTVGYFEMESQTYPIIPKIDAAQAQNPSQLEQIPLRTTNGDIIPLGNLADFSQTAKAQSLPHFQKMRAITLNASLTKGYTLGQAIAYLKTEIIQNLPQNIQIDYSGQSRQFIQSQGEMTQIFIFALLFIFLVLSAQFESFRNPLIVMLSVPLALFGALLTMHLTHCTLNIYTEIGLVTLIGLISKHGILIVTFAEQIRSSGKDLPTAAYKAASLRLRPILMTTAAMVLGAIPLILAHGAGSEARRQLGWVIVSGMGIGTLFTLLIIPTLYTFMAKQHDKGI